MKKIHLEGIRFRMPGWRSKYPNRGGWSSGVLDGNEAALSLTGAGGFSTAEVVSIPIKDVITYAVITTKEFPEYSGPPEASKQNPAPPPGDIITIKYSVGGETTYAEIWVPFRIDLEVYFDDVLKRAKR